MGVVRVRQSGVGAPLTEFDVPWALFELLGLVSVRCRLLRRPRS